MNGKPWTQRSLHCQQELIEIVQISDSSWAILGVWLDHFLKEGLPWSCSILRLRLPRALPGTIETQNGWSTIHSEQNQWGGLGWFVQWVLALAQWCDLLLQSVGWLLHWRGDLIRYPMDEVRNIWIALVPRAMIQCPIHRMPSARPALTRKNVLGEYHVLSWGFGPGVVLEVRRRNKREGNRQGCDCWCTSIPGDYQMDLSETYLKWFEDGGSVWQVQDEVFLFVVNKEEIGVVPGIEGEDHLHGMHWASNFNRH